MKRSPLPPRSSALVVRAGLQRTNSLQRTGPLERTTGLERAADLERGAGLARTAPMPRPLTPPKRPRVGSSIPAAVCKLIDPRDDVCARCGAAGHLERHHRRRKGMGGSALLDVPSNLVRLCGWGNHTGCHGWAHSAPRDEAEGDGYRLPDGVDWRLIPVRYWDGWHLLDDAGDRHPCEAPA